MKIAYHCFSCNEDFTKGRYNTSADISQRVGVDSYIAQIILQEAKRVATKMAAPPVVYDLSPPDNATPTGVAVEKREITEP